MNTTPSRDDRHGFWTLWICLLLSAATLCLVACATPAAERHQLRSQVDSAGLAEDAPPAPAELAEAAIAATPEAPIEPDVPAESVAEAAAHVSAPAETHAADAPDPLAQLMVANSTFADNATFGARRAETATGQHPMAIVLACADSRVPPEHIFGKGIGELFVVRVAGNVVSPEVLGSIEYGVEHLHAPLVIVLGHSKCGAVKATVEGGEAPGSIGSLVERIAPSVERAKTLGGSDEKILNTAIELNVRSMVQQVETSPLVGEALEAGHVRVVGACYDIESGRVKVLPAKKTAPAKKSTHAKGH